MARRRLQQKGDLYRQGGWWKLRWREDQIRADGALDRGWSRPVWIGPCAGRGRQTQKQAQRIAWDNFLSRLDQNTMVPQSVMTVAEFVEKRFQPGHITNLKRSGQQHYGYCLSKILPTLGDMRLRDVRRHHVQQLVATAKAGLSTQTAQHIRNAAHKLFEYAGQEDCFTGVNPAKHVSVGEMVRRQAHALTYEQFACWWRVIGDARAPLPPFIYRHLVLFSVLSGMNIAEVLGLQWERVNTGTAWATWNGEAIEPRSLLVRRQWYRGGYTSVKARSRRRTIPLSRLMVELLTDMRRAGAYCEPHHPVFAGRTGHPLDEHNVAARHLKPAGRKAGVPWVSWHVLRHTYSTLADQLEMSMGDRMAALGHTRALTTLRYTHSELERGRDVAERMAERLMGGTEGRLQ